MQWASRSAVARVSLDELLAAVDNLGFQIGPLSAEERIALATQHQQAPSAIELPPPPSISAVEATLLKYLEDRLHPEDAGRLLMGRPIVVLEAADGALSNTDGLGNIKLNLKSHGSLFAVGSDSYDLFVYRKSRTLPRKDDLIPALLLIHSSVEFIHLLGSARAHERSARDAVFARVKILERIGLSGVRASWPQRLVTFYDRARGGIPRMVRERFSTDTQLDSRLDGLQMTFSFGDVNAGGGDFVAGQHIQNRSRTGDDHVQVVDSTSLLAALEVISRLSESNRATLRPLNEAVSAGEDRGKLRELWENAKGLLGVVAGAGPALSAINAYFSSL